METLRPVLWPHTEACCGRDPIVGALYERTRRDILTGQDLGDETYRVISVDPIRLDRLFCRRMTLRCESTGKEYRPQVANFWGSDYRALENVVMLHHEKSPASES